MAEEHINREVKDRLFKFIFGNAEHKEFTLSLYNAINGTSYTTANGFEITSIENAIYMSMHNDLSFIVADTMNLYEQQSTYNPNMPLRMLCYTGMLYSKFLKENLLEEKMFNSSLVAIPCPKLIVFYNGERKQPNRAILKLSNSFNEGVKSDIEVKVTMLNVNYGRNKKLMEKCKPLSDYSLFVFGMRKWKSEGLDAAEAVDRAIEALSDDSEVKKLILLHKAEVAQMFLFEYNEEGVMNALKEEAMEIGKAEGKTEVAKAMLAKGIDVDTVSQCSGISVDELKRL